MGRLDEAVLILRHAQLVFDQVCVAPAGPANQLVVLAQLDDTAALDDGDVVCG